MIDLLEKTISEQSLQVTSLQLQIAELKKIVYGSKQEKFIATNGSNTPQLDLFPHDKIAEIVVTSATQVKSYEKKKTVIRVNHPGRNPLPEHLRREVIELQPEEDVSHLQPVGKEISEVLEYKPGEVFVKQIVRPEYILPSEDKLNAKRVIAPMPNLPLEKAMVGASLLAHMMVSKFVDHLPIYRQLEIFKRQQVNIDYTTASGWIKQGSNLIKPLYDAHCRHVLQSGYISVDETPIKVLDKDKKGTTHKGFYWVYYDTVNKLALFDYQPGRGGEFPKAMLNKFEGYLQSDGYVVYDQFDKHQNITTLNCWAHARRKFIEAVQYDQHYASLVLTQIQSLYRIEQYCTDNHFTSEQIKAYREEYTVQILENLHYNLQDYLTKVLPKSPLGKALQYTLARWDKLCVYVSNGILRIDNNLVENTIRPVALGRKNYLFAGNHEAAQDAAMIYSLFATCRLHNINPQQWLEDVLGKVRTTNKDQLHSLLPQNYTPATK